MDAKKAIIAAAAIIGTVSLLGACVPQEQEQEDTSTTTTYFNAEDNIMPTVYGPPQTDSLDTTPFTTTNIPELVYGPPEWFQ